MKWFNKLERKYGKYAIKNLMFYIIALYAFGFIISIFFPDVYTVYFSLNAAAIIEHGQIWRIVTFIIQPPTTSIIFILFSLYLYYLIGMVLENVWGAFKFNVYFFMGVLLQVLAAIFIYLVFGVIYQLSTYYINLALFMAYAMILPDKQLYLFFIIPVKIKWLAYLEAAYFAATIILGYISPWLSYKDWLTFSSIIGVLSTPEVATAALISMINFIVFFLMSRTNRKTKGQKAYRQVMKEKSRSYGTSSKQNEQSGTSDIKGANKFHRIAKHKCAVCGKTENDGDDLIFRFCSKCDGNYEYCNEHLYTHKHITKETKDNVSNFSNNN